MRDHAERARVRFAVSLAAGVSVLSATTLLATDSLFYACIPLGLALFALAFARLPPHQLGLALFFLAIVVDNPKEHPAVGQWESPLYPLGLALYENLNTLTGIQSLRFAGMDVLLIVALGVVALRRYATRDAVGIPRPMHTALVVSFVALLAVEAYGLARGGNFKMTLWQLRPLILVPAIAWIFASTIRGPRDLRPIGHAILFAAFVKVAMGAYFYFALCRPRGYYPDYVNTHSDSVLYVVAMVVAIAAWLERPTLRVLVTSGLVLAVVGLGVALNNRRLAYIELSGSLAAIAALVWKGALGRRLSLALGYATPPLAAYLAAGWTSTSGFFMPARKIASLFSKNDRSSGSRDCENYNLIQAWKHRPFFGAGFGHEYEELSRADSIDQFFPIYRYIGHDGVLWLFSVAGLFGFAAVWSVLVVVVYFAARAHRLASDPTQRAAALVSLSVIVCYAVQAYGDIGLQSWTGSFMLGAAIAIAGKLAIVSGAWPAADASTLPFVGRIDSNSRAQPPRRLVGGVA